MRQRADELPARIDRQIGIRIQRDDVAHGREAVELADHYDKAGIGCPSEQPVEFVQLSTLALPAHPSFFRGVPRSLAVKQVKALAAVLRVQASNQFDRELD